MAKAGVVGVPLDDFLEVAKKVNGIKIERQKGFYKLVGTIPGRAVYPQNNKIVNEVHFSGFSNDPKVKIPGLIFNPKYPKPTKRVTHFLDQREGSVTKDQILANFKEHIQGMVEKQVGEPVTFVKKVEEPVVVAAEKE